MTVFPRTLFLETTTRCNLACAMCARCQPGWAGGVGDMDVALFERLGEPLRHAETVILNGMGEPLLHPELPRMVRFVKERQPADGWCGLQTNGRLLDARLAGELATAGLDVLCVSHDGEAAALGHGAQDSLGRVAGLARAAGGRLRLGVETVLMRGNVAGLPALVDRAAGLGFSFVLASHLLPMDADSEAEGLFFPCSAAALRIFARHQAEARARGLDLAGVPRAAVMYNRGPEDRELMELLRRMQECAQAEGVWLNTARLAQADPARLEELEAIFAEARRRAQAAGLELRLPALTAPERPQERRCAFVEQEAAFIDWRGEVSPCHFLWHGYDCRVLGDPKRVEPRHFGNIARTPLAEIWRGPELAHFRQTARAGEYPACGDCGCGLCSDASGASGPFEQDCLGVSVPCGHCPWAVGQLLCMGA
jgi:putative metalloenzyme radical SAM/SPASM domain maturase